MVRFDESRVHEAGARKSYEYLTGTSIQIRTREPHWHKPLFNNIFVLKWGWFAKNREPVYSIGILKKFFS